MLIWICVLPDNLRTFRRKDGRTTLKGSFESVHDTPLRYVVACSCIRFKQQMPPSSKPHPVFLLFWAALYIFFTPSTSQTTVRAVDLLNHFLLLPECFAAAVPENMEQRRFEGSAHVQERLSPNAGGESTENKVFITDALARGFPRQQAHQVRAARQAPTMQPVTVNLSTFRRRDGRATLKGSFASVHKTQIRYVVTISCIVI